MLDINLNDPSLISDEISKLILHDLRTKEDKEEESEE